MKTAQGCYPFGPTIQYYGSSFSDIMDFVNSSKEEDSGVSYTVLPPAFAKQLDKDEKEVVAMVKWYLISKRGGFAYFTKSLADLIGLSHVTPIEVVCDLFIIPRYDVPYILTFSKEIDSPVVLRYNRRLSKAVLQKLRLFLQEDFTLAFGLVDPQDISSDQTFRKKLQRIWSSSTRFALRKYLSVSSSKSDAITRGFVAMVGISKHGVFFNNSDEETKSIRVMFTRDKLGSLLVDK